MPDNFSREEIWTIKELVSAVLQAGIAGFAYLQCPTIALTASGGGEKTEVEKA